MEYSRNKIIDRVKECKGQRGSSTYKRNKDIGNYVGYSEKSVKQWLDKNRTTPIPIDALIKMCELFDCDIEYLLGEYDCKHKAEEDIHKATGLEEESINILANSVYFTYQDGNSNIDETEAAFLKLINRIIQSHSFDSLMTPLDELKPDTFPISHISEYIAKSIRYENLKSNTLFDVLSYIDEGVTKGKYDSIAEGLKLVNGYTDEEIEDIRPLIWEYQELTEFNNHKRYERIDIQDAFSRFLASEYIESMGGK